MKRQSTAQVRDVFASPVLIGAILVVVGAVGMVLSYSANKGLPYVPVYEVKFDLPDAAELIVGSGEVRAAGARVGIIKKIEAVRGSGKQPAFARVTAALNEDQEGIPVDSTVQVRPRSVLGAKYIDLTLGKSAQEIAAGGVLPLSRAKPIVELDEAFNAFDKRTTRGLRGTITGLGNAVAGRGSAINEAIGSIATGIVPFQRVTRTVIARETDLDGFIRGAAAFNRALAPVSDRLAGLFDHGATTFGAIDAAGDALGRAIDELPRTEITGTRSLARLTPVLADAEALARGIRPGTAVLSRSSGRLADALNQGTITLRDTRALGDLIRAAFVRLARLVDSPHTTTTLRHLTATVDALGQALAVYNPAQIQCNVLGLWTRNVPAINAEGDDVGPWLSVQLVTHPQQSFQQSTPSADLHTNPMPHENTTECESGNEPFLPGQQIGNPPGSQSNTTQSTAPPAGPRARARQARLLSGGRR
jgi:phospholipid/cholesterol/gamma-HCH transport system substrate-binding protein